MEKVKKIINKLPWILVLLLVIPVIRTLLKPGYFGVSDDMHIAWLFEMDRTILAGKFPPRFVPDLSFGFGYPLFNFVFPLPFYMGEMFHLFGFSLVDSIKIVIGLSLGLSMLAMYTLLRRLTGVRLSILGSVVYGYAPYRATDIFVRGAVGESFAFIFYPIILLSFLNLLNFSEKRINWKWICLGALSISGLILSHNISAYMFIPFVLFFLLISFLYSSEKKRLLRDFSLLGLFGLLISSYFWIPAILDSQLMKYDTVFNFIDHFPTIKQLFIPYWGYGASVPGPYDGMSFFIGIAQITVALLGVFLFYFNRNKIPFWKRLIIIWSIVSLFISIFMMNYRSTFIWKAVPLITYFQFPWRFLSIIVFFISLLVICLENIRMEKYISLLLIIGSIYLGLIYFKPSEYLGRMDNYYLNRYIPYPEASSEYKKTSEEYLRLLKGSAARPDKNYPELYGSGFEILGISKPNSLDIRAVVTVPDIATVNFSRYNFPGWKVLVDGKKVVHTSGSPFGQITFKLTQSKHEIEIIFTETPLKKLLNSISLIFFTISIILVMRKYERDEK